MTRKNCLKEVEKSLIIETQDENREKAYGNIFSILRKKVYSEVHGLIIHMEPLEVYELEKSSDSYTERFLGIFMPREKMKYSIKVEVVVRIKYIEL